MAKARRKEFLERLSATAGRYARFYFDPTERARTFAETGVPAGGDYAVLVVNHFVPVDAVAGSAAMLRKFVRAVRVGSMRRRSGR